MVSLRSIGAVLSIFVSLLKLDAAVEKLDAKYCISFGDAGAPTKVVEYFSFTCPHCLDLYRDDFSSIREHLIETGKVHWIFHPVPLDMLTVQAMGCLEELTEKEKQVFLEAVLPEMDISDGRVGPLLLQKAMEFFGKEGVGLADPAELKDTAMFQDAFRFASQETKIQEVPTVEINGKLYRDSPNERFIRSKVKGEA